MKMINPNLFIFLINSCVRPSRLRRRRIGVSAAQPPADTTSAEDRSQERPFDRNYKQSMKKFWHLEITAISSSMKFRA